MGLEQVEVEDLSSTPKLALFTVSAAAAAAAASMASPERSGSLTPPVHATAAVPFRWEEEPGKPRPSTALTVFTGATAVARSLHLPPRLHHNPNHSKIPQMPSPTTVLDGPYLAPANPPHAPLRRSSFSHRRRRGGSPGRVRRRIRTIVLGNEGGRRRRGQGIRFGGGVSLSWWSYWGWKRREKGKWKGDGEGSFVFSNAPDVGPAEYAGESDSSGRHTAAEASGSGRRKKGGGGLFNVSPPKSHIWATIYQGLKKVIPWRTRKSKQKGLSII